ncbi:MAG: TolC family protein [Armatimonadota bacterium]|nr:TolC family protein [Armatimonadota bacterium]MDR7450881.1 TolC family protein [Armatimonadota bacterium]MDR7465803.1 TolC family protein [Armatimonadota bacterium]MDR7493711.1 TolC family protein [Armatimonadota bacterium]MDR7500567.1 TolC family protein [Armatimonadota bacterium]
MRTVAAVAIVCLSSALVVPPAAEAQSQPVPEAVTFEAALVSALTRHPTVIAAERAVEAAEARLVQARAGTALQVGLSGRASYGTISSTTGAPTGGEPSPSHNISVGASLPLYDGGLRALQILQAQALLDAARAQLAAARQDVVLAAAQAYFQVLRARRTVEVREAVLRTAQAQVEQAEAFFRAGTAAQADVVRARAAAATAFAEVVAARGQVETALAALRSAMAVPLHQAVSVSDPAMPAVPTVAAADAAAEAVRQRPEVRRAEAEVRGAEAALRLARLAAGLQVSLGATTTVQVSPDPGQAGWGISATVSYPLFDAGRTAAAVREAAANLQAATARRDATVLQVQTQAYQAVVGLAAASARAEATRVSAEAAQEALRVTEGRYRAGVGTLVDVLTAQSDAAEARVAAVQAVYDLQQAVVTLQYALGRALVAGR